MAGVVLGSVDGEGTDEIDVRYQKTNDVTTKATKATYKYLIYSMLYPQASHVLTHPIDEQRSPRNTPPVS